MLVALMVAASSSIASAQPTTQPREERGGRVPFGRWRAKPPTPPPRTGDWIKLATPTPTRFGTEWIMLGQSAGAFRALRIEAVSGTVHLRVVRVELTGGKMATFNVDQWLDARHPNTRIDLGSAVYIDHLAITTDRVPAGSYVVYGAWSIAPTGELVALR